LEVAVKYLNFPPRFKSGKVTIEGDTIRDLIDELSKKHGSEFKDLLIDKSTGEKRPEVMISTTNGLISDLQGLKTKVKDSDEVTFCRLPHAC
jgi:molybdopterin converting factor small subunit